MSKPDAMLLRAMYAQADEACAVADRAEWLVEFNEWLRNPRDPKFPQGTDSAVSGEREMVSREIRRN